MWQFYVLPWLFCELPGPNFQSRKFKLNFADVFQFILRYLRSCVLFPLLSNIGFWNHENALCPSFLIHNDLLNKVYILQWRHKTEYFVINILLIVNLRVYLKYVPCWHLYEPEAPESKYWISFHAFWNLRLPKWNSFLLIFSQPFIISIERQ